MYTQSKALDTESTSLSQLSCSFSAQHDALHLELPCHPMKLVVFVVGNSIGPSVPTHDLFVVNGCFYRLSYLCVSFPPSLVSS